MRSFLKRSLTALCVFVVVPQIADIEAEREALSLLVFELTELQVLIDRAEREADLTQRIRFRYDWLRRDLELVRRGIQDHLDAPSTEPRTFPPLQGDYRR